MNFKNFIQRKYGGDRKCEIQKHKKVGVSRFLVFFLLFTTRYGVSQENQKNIQKKRKKLKKGIDKKDRV